MRKIRLRGLSEYMKQSQRRRGWRKLVQVMACIVVFCTTYALILPAITMEKDKCVLEEHTHGESCYEKKLTDTIASLSCTYETLKVHVHGPECTDESGNLLCGMADFVIHTHDAACMTADGLLICQLPEIAAHTHSDACYASAEAGHEHTDACYTVQRGALTCQRAETEGHTHGQDCFTRGNLLCEVPESGEHTHDAACYESVLTCELAEEAAHAHEDSCYEQISVLNCQAETVPANTEAPELICGKEELHVHAHGDGCYEIYTDENGEDQERLICTELILAGHFHGEGCYVTEEVPAVDADSLTCPLTEGHVHADGCYDESGELTCSEVENHTHGEMCYGTWVLICGKEEHTHTEECTGLSEEETARVEAVIAMIDAMPSGEEIDARAAEYQNLGDEDGEIAYLEQTYAQVQQVYLQYSALGEELQQYVSNADKLLELEYIWSAEVLATYTKDPTIYQINSYVYYWSSGATMAHGGTVGQALGVSWEFVYWIGVVVEEDSGGNLYVEQIADSGTNKNSLKADSANGFVLLFADGFDEKPIVSVGDFVTVDASIPDKGALKYTESTGVTGGYGKVHFSSAINSITSAAPTPVKTASTKEFVELNLYDYNGYVNANYWAKNNWYPGFQWNGGAYSKTGTYGYQTDYTYSGIGVPYAETDRHVIDSIDFGNSLITNLTYGYGAAGDYTKAINATAVGYADKSKTHPINWLYGNSTEGYTNKPIGYSTTDLTESQNVMKYTLVDGYPALTDGTMLNYLFKDGVPAKKLNTESIDGLFQVNPISGLYYYNCRENHAQYENNKFTVYAQKLTPNFITYPFGNFLPLNSITDSSKATQVGAFNRPGGMRDYVERILLDLENNTEGLDSGWKSSQDQLTAMLEEYKENWLLHPRTLNDTNNTWTNLSPANAIRDYFLGDTAGGGDNPSDNTDFITQPFLDDLYSLDWDVQTNFFFGMEMKMNVMMPKDGLTGKDNGNNSMPWEAVKEGEYAGTFIRGGEPDGIPDYPMVFNFTGDDDVWVYVDGVLFLDLSGIHRHVGGTIDFQTGTVYYFALDTASGDTHQHDPGTSSYYKKFSFKEILSNAGQDTSVLNEKGTFKDYTTHTFNFYYMERGSGSSVCRINFNFPMLKKNSISVTKENTTLEGGMLGEEVLGNPDYYFNIINNNNELFVGPGSVTGVSDYTVMNSDGTYVTNADGSVKTFTTDQYGIFTLKAGQTAVFEGITENSGTYYVQELIKAEDDAQYPTVKINLAQNTTIGGVDYDAGTVQTTRYNDLVDWSYRKYFYPEERTEAVLTGPYGYQWYGRSGYNTDAGRQASFYFEQQNRVDTAKLGKLSISKVLVGMDTNRTFDMEVTLDGEKLPVGTKYTVGTQEKSVETEGIITLGPGETATISNIISGTRFTVREINGGDYNVGYDYSGHLETDTKDFVISDSVSGVIRTQGHVTVTVTNSERAAQLSIPVTKRFHQFAEGTYSYTFTLTEANADGSRRDGGLSMEKTVEVTSDNFQFELDPITYLAHQFEGDSAKYYYLIEEKGENPDNTQCFLVEVTVTRAGDGSISAAITNKYQKNGENWEAVTDVTFVNILTGSLSLEKILVGSNTGQQFSFTIKLDAADTGLDLSGMQFAVTGKNADGTDFTDQITAEGENYLICHGERLTIHGIPLGVQWTITENTTTGYLVTTRVGEVTGESSETSGSITAGDTQVVYTNTQTYVLPETGGTGTIPYTMAGLVLMLFSMAYLMYRPKARGRGSYRSP